MAEKDVAEKTPTGTGRRQVLEERRNQKRYPVITLVLYFGDAEWNKPRNLLGCLEVPEKLKPFVHDDKINLFEICKLSEKQISNFKSDFKIIADYFVKRKKISGYRGSKETIKHVDEFFKLMKVLTNDTNIENVYNERIFNEEGETGMAGYFTNLINEGKAEGNAEGKAEIIQALIKNGNMTIEQIAAIVNLPVEKVKELSEMELASA